ncbi:transglycosylase SLT domain-containing protein [Motiliproteus sediminis]|uniref:transglycosylase SLT domain-containing protein n=1 Tax=Motiliproteus sediminis TaxID=1468178 RepID=UPI001AEF8082|nr:transglycosylase SLT domain-containing protein [Motiliproteus sediminis]
MRHFLLTRALAGVIVASAWLPLSLHAGPAPSIDAQRQLYQQAREAFEQRDTERYEALKAQLTDYVLYPYLDYNQWRRELSQLDSPALTDFQQRYADTPLPRLLQRHWLAYLGKRKQWQTLVDGYDADIANLALECLYRRALYNIGDKNAAYHGLEELWVVGRSQHSACDAVFEPWLKSEQFNSNFAWQRFWLALANNNRTLARYTQRFVTDAARKQMMEQALDLQHRPEKLLRMNKATLQSLPSRTRKIALERLSRVDPDAYLGLLEKHQLQDEPAYKRTQERAVMRLLRSYNDRSHHWASAIDPEYRSLELLEWRIREALFRQDWGQVGTLLEALPASSRFNDRWRYWQARQLDQGSPEQRTRAQQIFTELSRSRSFYGFLAADRVGASYSLNNDSEPASAEQLSQLAALPGIQRARELFHHQQLIEARREWFHATRNLNEEQHYQLAQLARSWGWYAQGIRAAIEAKRWNDLVLRFPLAHNQQAAQQAKKHRIDTPWILAIIRQESAFMADARSPAGAMGLMQLMPATAKQTARQQKLRYRNSSQLHDPEFNMALGSAYLAAMHRRFDQQRALASAAYNAGPYRVKQWLEHRGHLSVDAWIETIPFDETRHYVQNVLSYALIYSDLLGLPKTFMFPHETRPLQPGSDT